MSGAAGLTMPAIAQGARSVARVVQIAGSACVEKRFNAYRDPPSIKLTRELAFYRAYPDVPVMPTLVSHRAPDTITLRYVEGERLIDLIESKAVDADDIAEVSEHYGTVPRPVLRRSHVCRPDSEQRPHRGRRVANRHRVEPASGLAKCPDHRCGRQPHRPCPRRRNADDVQDRLVRKQHARAVEPSYLPV